MEKWRPFDAEGRVVEAVEDSQWRMRRRNRSHLVPLAHLALFASLVFCLKWQPWLTFLRAEKHVVAEHNLFDLEVGSVLWGECSGALDPRLECGYLAYVAATVLNKCQLILTCF